MPLRGRGQKRKGNLKQTFGAALELLLYLTLAQGAVFFLDGEGEKLRSHLSVASEEGFFTPELDLVLESFARKVRLEWKLGQGKGWFTYEKGKEVVSLLGGPIVLPDKTIGVVVLVTRGGTGYTREEEGLLRRVLNHLERVVQRVECGEFKFFRNNMMVLPSLPRSVKNFKVSLDLRDLLDSIADVLAEVIEYDVCLLLLAEESGEELRAEVLRSNVANIPVEAYYSADAGVLPLVYQQGCPVLIEDISQDPRLEEFFQGHKGALLAVPVEVEGRVLGALVVASCEVGNFSRQDLDTLGTFAAQVGTMYQLAANCSFWEGYQYQVIESVPAAVIAMDHCGYITTFNSMAEKLFGRQGKALGSHYREIVSQIENRYDLSSAELDLEEIVEGILEKGEPFAYRNLVAVDRQTRREKIVNLSFSPIWDSAQKIWGVTAVIENVTNTFQLENTLRQAEKMAALGELAAGVAHEIRNPLTAIKGFAQLLQQECSVKEKEQLFRVMLGEVDRVEEIIRGLLLFTNCSGCRMELMNVHQLLVSLVPLLKAEATLQDVEVVLDSTPDLPPIKGNSRELREAFVNIGANALQAMPYGGQLTITGQHLEKEGVLQVEFADTGCGIPPEEYNRIFDPFFTTKEEGPGLGLPVAYRIIQKHGGEIMVESQVGEGTSFIVKLPVPGKYCFQEQGQGGEEDADDPGSGRPGGD